MEAQRALRASEERHRAMFDHFPLGVYRCTPEGSFLDANPALVRILGYPDRPSLDSIYSSTFYVSDEDAEVFMARLKEFGIVRGFETRLRGVDGRTIRLRNTARIHRDSDGKVAYVEGVIEDVSRERLKLVLNRDAARYKALYESDHIGILTLDPSGKILDGNLALQTLSGYDEEDLSSMEYAEFFEEGNRAEVLDEIRQVSEGASTNGKVSRDLRMKGGSDRAVSTLSILVTDGDGKPNHIIIVLEGC